MGDDEAFGDGFIGASVQSCQNWALEVQFQDKSIEQDVIAVADARTARDGTISIQVYFRDVSIEFPGYGTLPPRCNTWYDFRVDYRGSVEVIRQLYFGPPDSVYPVYFARKKELVDENGVFDVKRATRMASGIDPDTSSTLP